MLLASPLLFLVHETQVVTRFRAPLAFRLRLFNLFFIGLGVWCLFLLPSLLLTTVLLLLLFDVDVLLCCCVTASTFVLT